MRLQDGYKRAGSTIEYTHEKLQGEIDESFIECLTNNNINYWCDTHTDQPSFPLLW